MNKQALRGEMRSLRAGLPAQEQEAASRAAAQRILALAEYKAAKTVMAYIAVRGEIDLAPVIADVLASGRRLALPRCEAPGVMTARAVSQLDELVAGTYGLPEPPPQSAIVSAEEIDLILVPGTAFGRDGSRLGQGGGYYDRFLPGTNAYCVGVCHDFALMKSLPMQEHDMYMNAVITPGGRIPAGKAQEERP